MAKMRISPELKKLIEKYRCVKDTEGMSPAKVYKLVGENENLYLKMTDSRYKGTTYDVEREKDMMLQSNDSYGNYGALKPHTNKGLLPYHS